MVIYQQKKKHILVAGIRGLGTLWTCSDIISSIGSAISLISFINWSASCFLLREYYLSKLPSFLSVMSASVPIKKTLENFLTLAWLDQEPDINWSTLANASKTVPEIRSERSKLFC